MASGAMLAFSPAGMTQKTDSLGLQLNAKASFQGAVREQSREHASILKVLKLGNQKQEN